MMWFNAKMHICFMIRSCTLELCMGATQLYQVLWRLLQVQKPIQSSSQTYDLGVLIICLLEMGTEV
jgi:hypothetical protein